MMLDLGLPQAIVLLVAVQRIAELGHARRNTRRLLAEGGREVGAGHYAFMVALHAGWLAALFVLIPSEAAVQPSLLAAFVLLQLGRLWVIASLGPFWTTRIVTLPEAPLVRRGPYKFMRHPNYAIVALEIPILPLTFGDWKLAISFGVLNACLLIHRIRVEEKALAPRRVTEEVGSSA